jgi:hypothetical protein
MPTYDLLVYHDMSDSLHDSPPALGTDAGDWFGDSFSDLSVVAVAPGIHEGRITVVLAHSNRPMEDMQAFFDRG